MYRRRKLLRIRRAQETAEERDIMSARRRERDCEHGVLSVPKY